MNKCLLIGGLVGVLALGGVSTRSMYAQNTSANTQSEESRRSEHEEYFNLFRNLTEESATEILRRGNTVDEILQPFYDEELIKEIEGNERGRIVFQDTVYQNSIPTSERVPTVSFYVDLFEGGHLGSRTSAVLFCAGALQYSEHVNFVFVDISSNPAYNKLRRNGEYPAISWIKNDEHVRGVPRLVIYAPFDRLEGQSPRNPANSVLQIDALVGAPGDASSIPTWYTGNESFTDWIESNFCLGSLKNYVVRVRNSSTPQTIMLTKR